ncbi:MAG TPA: SH3 domain-containing protein [Coleofasciculaceae cyanobacterium]
MHKLIKSLLTIPVISLSVIGLNVPLVAIATPVTAKNSQVTAPIQIAQGLSCSVVNIRTGQLALRFSPNGRVRAGLDNGNTVELLQNGPGVWRYVRVINGPNNQVDGLEGWVNSNYLACDETNQAPQISCEVINIQTGQLALRFSPNGASKAGLDNGNIVRWLKDGPGIWVYVRVIDGPNGDVNGLEGWVNSNYLSCYD